MGVCWKCCIKPVSWMEWPLRQVEMEKVGIGGFGFGGHDRDQLWGKGKGRDEWGMGKEGVKNHPNSCTPANIVTKIKHTKIMHIGSFQQINICGMWRMGC